MEMLRKMFGWLRSEEGQTVIEYVLVIVLISLAVIYAFYTGTLSTAISDAATAIADAITAGVANIGG